MEVRKEGAPGPGQYEIKKESGVGVVIGKDSKESKDMSTRRDVPGPGQYDHHSSKDTPAYGFGSSEREQMKDSGAPGPGQYTQQGIIGKDSIPLGGLHNRRSLIYVENLVDAIARALEARQSHAQVYTLADCDLSTTQLIRAMAVALGHPARVSDVPASVLNFFGTVFGKRETTRRLTGSLVVDRSAFVRDFDWVPPVSLEVAMARTAGWMRAQDATE